MKGRRKKRKALEIAAKGIIKIDDLEKVGYKLRENYELQDLAEANYFYALLLIEEANADFNRHIKERFETDGCFYEWRKGRNTLFKAIKYYLNKMWY